VKHSHNAMSMTTRYRTATRKRKRKIHNGKICSDPALCK